MQNKGPHLQRLFILQAVLLASLLVFACSGGSDAEPTPIASPADNQTGATSSGPSTSARVAGALISNAITEDNQATGFISRAFPINTMQVFAVVAMEGMEAGTEIEGRWFQLSTPDAPPEGHQVSVSKITLAAESLVDGRAGIALALNGGGQNLPSGDWVIRIYANGVFLRTMAFVITEAVILLPEVPGSEGGAPAIESAGEYTVQAGDSLLSIAEALKAPNETAELFIARLIQLNSLQPDSELLVGQVLQVPAPP